MGDWIVSNAYLSRSEMDNNAGCMQDDLVSMGWTDEAIAAVAGNFERESSLNPGIWQSLNAGNLSGGLGLGQWTPASKLLNWMQDEGLKWDDGYNQCYFLNVNDGQWHEVGRPGIPSHPPITWDEFKHSKDAVATLTTLFYQYWEDPSYSDDTLPKRLEAADYYYKLFTGRDPEPPNPPNPGGGGWRKMKRVFMLTRYPF